MAVKKFISNEEMVKLEKSGQVQAPSFISDEEMESIQPTQKPKSFPEKIVEGGLQVAENIIPGFRAIPTIGEETTKSVLTPYLAKKTQTSFQQSKSISDQANQLIEQAKLSKDATTKYNLLKQAGDLLRGGEQVSRQGEELLGMQEQVVPSERKLVGAAGQAATGAAEVALLRGLPKGIKEAKKITPTATRLGQLAKQGAITGGKIGALQGLGTGIGEITPEVLTTKEKLKTLGKETLKGAAIGAATGFVLEPLTGLPKRKSITGLGKEGDTVWEKIQPKLTQKEYEAAQKSGKIVKSGPLGTIKQIPSKKELEMVEVAKPYIAKDELQSLKNMKSARIESAKNIRSELDKSGAIWNRNELSGIFKDVRIPTTIKNTPIEKVFKNLKNATLEIADKSNKKLSGLLDVRQKLDDIIELDFGPAAYDAENPMSNVILDFRRKINDLIENKLPVDNIYRKELRKQTLLYDAEANIARKTPKIGTNAIQRWIKANPAKAKAIGYTLGGGFGYGVLKNIGLPLP